MPEGERKVGTRSERVQHGRGVIDRHGPLLRLYSAPHNHVAGLLNRTESPKPSLDRLTSNGTIIETGTDSYRLASTRARTEAPAKAG